MFERRIAVSALVACAAFGAPAAAGAATLNPTKQCVADGDSLELRGAGFTPNGVFQLQGNGQAFRPTDGRPLMAGPTGAFRVAVKFPFEAKGRRLDVFRAVDTANMTNVGSTTVRHVTPSVKVTPLDANASAVRRIRASGFTVGTTLYGHRVRGKRVVNYRVGKLTGLCKSLSLKRRLLPRGIRTGTYRLQFDTFRKYRASRTQRFRFRVKVVRTAVRKSAAFPVVPAAIPKEIR
jgi:hypothetical protein